MGRTARSSDGVQERDLLTLEPAVRRFLSGQGADPVHAQDLTQETLLRVWEARHRIDRAVAPAYAVATARNLLISERRKADLHRRHAHRLVPADTADTPDEQVLRREEWAAAQAALAALESADRELLTATYAGDRPPVAPRPPGLTARLAAARSRARVAYLLALRRVDPPTSRCRDVLEALSSGDRRRQERLGTPRHLLSCPACAELAGALLHRQRAAFGLLPVPLLLADGVRPHRWLTPRTSAGVAAVAAAAVVGTAVLLHDGAAPPPRPGPVAAPVAASGRVVAQGAVLMDDGVVGDVRPTVGHSVVGTSVHVQSVPADEGFWIGRSPTERLWVQLRTEGESAQQVRAGDVVSLRGSVVSLDTPPSPLAALTPAEGRDQLVRQGAYLLVRPQDLTPG